MCVCGFLPPPPLHLCDGCPQEFGKIVDNVLEVVMLRDVGAVKFTEASAEVRLLLPLLL
jgi:hypothetical protein